jgi:hypothetical protein
MIASIHSCKGLITTESTDYSLWKATKKIKHVKKPSSPLRTSQGTWARSSIEKTHAFAEHLAKVFQSNPSEIEPEEEALTQLLETPYQLEPPINHFKTDEVHGVINSLNPKKSSGYGLITGKFLSDVRCFLGGGNHPANYKGCIVYKELQKKIPTSPFETHSSRRNQRYSTHSTRSNICSNKQTKFLCSHKYTSRSDS